MAGLLVRLVMCVGIRSSVRLRVGGAEQVGEIGPPGTGRRQRLCPRLLSGRAFARGADIAQSLLDPEIGGEEDVRIAESAHADVSVAPGSDSGQRSEEHTSELQSRGHLVCRLLL